MADAKVYIHHSKKNSACNLMRVCGSFARGALRLGFYLSGREGNAGQPGGKSAVDKRRGLACLAHFFFK